MRLKYKLLISFVIIFCSILFGALIIYVTPHLYNLHPFSENYTQSEDEYVERPKILLLDTLEVKGDTLISRSKIIEQSNPNTPKTAPTIGDLGTFGDSAGFWNAIFSALAMTFVVVTLIYQSNKDSKDDERARIAQFQEQCLTMLSMLSEIVSQLRIPQTSVTFTIESNNGFPGVWNPSSNQGFHTEQQETPNPVSTNDVTGRACFKYIYDERPEGRNIRDFIGRTISNSSDVPTEEFYQSLKKVTETHFDHYFRTVYRILKFIKESDLGDIEKKKQDDIRDLCADLIRAQLSTYELAILYYNGLFPKYRKTSKVIYEHFCIFDNLDPNFLLLPSEKDYYQQVQLRQQNPDNYDVTIHYNCTAFTKVHHTKENNKSKSIWHKVLQLLLKKRHNNSVESVITAEELTSQEIAVYNILKSRSGQIITTKELERLSRLKGKELKIILEKFERIVRIDRTPQGKRYTVIKEL